MSVSTQYMSALPTTRRWPDRPRSVDPAQVAAATTSSSRPQLLSSFSNSISSTFSMFGRHSRSNSSASSQQPVRPSSAAPHAKWNPKSNTPAPQQPSQTTSTTRHRSTSSASAAAAALATPISPNSNQGSEPPLPPIPAEATPTESPSNSYNGGWRQSIQTQVKQRYHLRMREAEVELQNNLRTAHGGLNRTAVSSRRDSSSSGSSGASERCASEEQKFRVAYEQTATALGREMQDEKRAEIRREEARRRGEMPPPAPPVHRSAPIAVSKSQDRGILVEADDDSENTGESEGEDWLWRPEVLETGDRDERYRFRDAVRQEQQVIWDTIKRESPTISSAAQQQILSTSASRKVHFAGPSSASNNSSSTPNLPRTPHSSSGGYPSSLGIGHVRSSSAHPYPSHISTSSSRSMSPVVATSAVAVRPGSARPASPATATATATATTPNSATAPGYARWLPTSASQLPTSTSVNGGSHPIAIPGSRDRERDKERERSADRASGSWRDWGTPSPSSHGHQVYYPHGRMPSNGNLHISTGGKTPSNGNLAATASANAAGSDVTSSNTTTGQGLRRAVTPGVSSASGYASARQRTISTKERAPSTPPILGQYSTTSRERERREGRRKEKDRERGHTKNLSRANVVDDRDPDDSSPISTYPTVVPQRPPSAPHYIQSTYPASKIRLSSSQKPQLSSNLQVQAIAMQKRTSSSRSALVDEDAPPSAEAIIMERHSSSHPNSSQQAPPSPAPIPAALKGKGKATSPSVNNTEYTYNGKGGMYSAQLEDFASMLRRELRISAEA